MAQLDELLATIEAIHAAGLDAGLWPKALARVAEAVGGNAATIELFDKRSLSPRELYYYGIPPAAEFKYLEQYFPLNRRLPVVARDPLGQMSWDYRIFDERTIRRDPFYMEFLANYDLRYFIGGIIVTNAEEFAGVCVHRSPKQGHIDKAGVAMMERFLPHVRGAFDVARRLKGAGNTRRSLERALDWLADGVALLGADNAVIYANEAFRAVARRNDGIAVKHASLKFAAADVGPRLDLAIASARRLRAGEPNNAESSDFLVPRPSGAPPYLVSVRPLLGDGRSGRATEGAVAIVFVRDPLNRNAGTTRMMREVFGLTEAEANLALELRAGIPLPDYARARSISLNTVYTHLRRLKEKTGCNRMAELIRKLNDLQVPIRNG